MIQIYTEESISPARDRREERDFAHSADAGGARGVHMIHSGADDLLALEGRGVGRDARFGLRAGRAKSRGVSIMRNRGWLLACGVVLALTGCPAGAQAEDYCDTVDIVQTPGNRISIEKKVREKCKAGDIVFLDAGFLIPRLCDLHQPVVRCGSICHGGDQASFFFLAPPHRTY